MADYGPLENVRVSKPEAADTKHLDLVAWGTCPGCGLTARISGDQYRGEVSVDCPECDYHETHDHREGVEP